VTKSNRFHQFIFSLPGCASGAREGRKTLTPKSSLHTSVLTLITVLFSFHLTLKLHMVMAFRLPLPTTAQYPVHLSSTASKRVFWRGELVPGTEGRKLQTFGYFLHKKTQAPGKSTHRTKAGTRAGGGEISVRPSGCWIGQEVPVTKDTKGEGLGGFDFPSDFTCLAKRE